METEVYAFEQFIAPRAGNLKIFFRLVSAEDGFIWNPTILSGYIRETTRLRFLSFNNIIHG